MIGDAIRQIALAFYTIFMEKLGCLFLGDLLHLHEKKLCTFTPQKMARVL